MAALCLVAGGCRDDAAGGEGDTDPPPLEPGANDAQLCADLCGDGECGALEDCATCAIDCGAQECETDGLGFLPGHAAIAMGQAFEDRCGDGVATGNPLGLAGGAEMMPFERSRTPLDTAVGCGGVADDEPTIAQDVSLRDGALASTTTCLSLLGNSKAAALEVGLRYEVGRWRESSAHPGEYERPGTQGVGAFWFASYSRRLHGAVPEWTAEPWASEDLPDSLTLLLEDYRAYDFVRDGSTRQYRQSGIESETASVAFLEVMHLDAQAACVAAGDPFRVIANNDIVLHYTDGTRDVFSGRDLTFKGRIEQDLSHLVVTHGTRGADGAESCGAVDAVGVKRISSYAAFSNEPLGWIDLEHEYAEYDRPGHDGQTLGIWQLRRIVDSEGRVITVTPELDRPGQIEALTIYEGAPDERTLTFEHDAAGIISSISAPAPSLDEHNTVTMVHEHPPSEGGLSRVASQTRLVSGTDASTMFTWSDSELDLEVGLPGGHLQRFGHERPQGATQFPLRADGRDANRLVARYAIDATSNPERTAYDPRTGRVSETCDALSPGPEDGDAVGHRCVGYVYDDDHDLVEVVEWSDGGALARTRMEYAVFAPANDHRLETVTGPMGDELRYRYETDSWLEGRIDSVRMVEQVDTLGNVSTIEWCSGAPTCPWGHPAAAISAVGGRTDYVYDPVLGAPMITRDGDLVQERTAYDARGCLRAKDTRDGVPVQGVFLEGQGDCLPAQIIENPDGQGEARRVTAYAYDAARNTIRVTRDAEGTSSNAGAISESDFQVIDAAGTQAPVRERTGLGGDTTSSETAFTYAPLGELVAIDELDMGRTTQIEYQRFQDGALTIHRTRSGLDGARRQEINPAGQSVLTSDEVGITSAYAYDDASGRLTSESTGVGAERLSTHYTYALDGKLTERTEPDGVVTLYFYDDARRLIGQDRAGVTDMFELDDVGRTTSHHRELTTTGQAMTIETRFTENGRGSRVQSIAILPNGDGADPITSTRHYETDAMSWGACQASEPGNCYEVTQIDLPREHASGSLSRLVTHDALGRLVQATTVGTQSAGRVSFDYAYDGLDCLRRISGGGGVQTFECDRAGRRTAETAWGTRAWDYYPDGSPRTFVDFNGTQTHYELDASRWRVGRISYSDEPEDVVHVENIAFDYLDNDLLLSMQDGSGTTDYLYDSLGRVRGRTHTPSDGGESLTVGYEYGENSARLRAMDYWLEERVEYAYDDQGRVASIDAFGADQSYRYDQDGRLLAAVTELPASAMSSMYGYDPLHRLDRIEHSLGTPDAPGDRLLHLGYGNIDAHGNIGSIQELWNTSEPPIIDSFTYDENDRLEHWEHGARAPEFWNNGDDEYLQTFGMNAYDSRSNATTFMGRELSYDEHDRITTEGFAYDGNGNLTCLDDPDCGCLINGIQDGDEEGVDCGGKHCAPCSGGGECVFPERPVLDEPCPPDTTERLDWAALEAQALALNPTNTPGLIAVVPVQYQEPVSAVPPIPSQLRAPLADCSLLGEDIPVRATFLGGATSPVAIGTSGVWNTTVGYKRPEESFGSQVGFIISSSANTANEICQQNQPWDQPIPPQGPGSPDYALAPVVQEADGSCSIALDFYPCDENCFTGSSASEGQVWLAFQVCQ